VKRHLWSQNLTATYCPAWPCPRCKTGTLALDKQSFRCEETVGSKKEHSVPEWEPEWVRYVFSTWAKCQTPACGEAVAISGTGSMRSAMEDDGNVTWEDYFSPLFCFPMPPIIDIPQKCPQKIREELGAAFGAFWSLPASCAGRIRVVLEHLMNHIGVQGNDLHSKLDAFAKNDPAVGAQLMALKWLGNSGSHVGEVSQDDLLNAFEILEHSLSEIIDQRSANVSALAKKLADKHKN